MFLSVAQEDQLAGIAGSNENAAHAFRVLHCSHGQPLLRIEMGHVGIASVAGDPENPAAVAGEGQQPLGARGQRIDDLILAGP